MLLALALAAAAPAPPDADHWYLIVARDGATIGHSRRHVVLRPDGRELVEDREIKLQEEGDPVATIAEQDVVRQDAQGRTVALSHYSQSGRSWTRTEARIEGDRAEIVRQTNGDRRTVTVALPPGVRFDGGSGLLAHWDQRRPARLEFDDFSLDAMAVEHVVIAPAPPDAADPPGGSALLRMRYAGGTLSSLSRLRLARESHVTEIVQPMYGTSTILRPTDRETALRPYPPYHAVPAAMIRSPFRISDAAGRGHIRYLFSFNDGLAFAIPQTAEQRVTAEGEHAIVDICAACGPGLPTDPAYLADARRPTAWLQSDRPELREIAAPVARLHLSDARKMALLLAAARPYLATLDFAGHYSALETIRRRAGDCTEAAVLLAALGRAAGIPTRVVNGIVYSRPRYHGVSNAFLPHSWTLAYVDGAWRSFDLALEAFDATHVALSIGDGDARSIQAAGQLAGLLHWDGMSEVRPRPGGGAEAQPASRTGAVGAAGADPAGGSS
jgi:hypothetical protein